MAPIRRGRSVALDPRTFYVRVEAILNTGAARFITLKSNVVQVTVP